VFHQIAYQLTVTRRGADPDPGVSSAKEWELGNSGFNGEKRRKISDLAVDTTPQRYGWAPALSTALGALLQTQTCQGFHHFDRLFALPSQDDWASVPPPVAFLEDKDFP
jgi:hypothetical protein